MISLLIGLGVLIVFFVLTVIGFLILVNYRPVKGDGGSVCLRFLVCALAVFAFIGSVLAINDVTVYPGVCIRPDNNVTIVTGNTFHWSDLNVYSSYAEMGSVRVYPSCSTGQVNMTLYSLSNRSAVFNVAPVSPVSIRFDWPTAYPVVMNISCTWTFTARLASLPVRCTSRVPPLCTSPASPICSQSLGDGTSQVRVFA